VRGTRGGKEGELDIENSSVEVWHVPALALIEKPARRQPSTSL
jgi:hypothetical protein